MFRFHSVSTLALTLLLLDSWALWAQQAPDQKAESPVTRLGSTRFHHRHRLTSVAFIPGGKLIASADYQGHVYLWDAVSGHLVRELLDRPGHILAAAPGGKVLATIGRNGAVQVWEIATGQLVHTLQQGPRKVKSRFGVQGHALAFSPDGTTLVAALHEAVHVWNVDSGKEVAVLAGQKQPISAVAMAPDGKTIATGDSIGYAPNDFTAVPNCTITLWDASTHEPLRSFPAHHGWIYGLAFSHDSKSLASASPYDVCLWRVATGAKLAKLEGMATGVAFSPTANVLVTGRNVTLWDSDTKQKRRELDEQVSYASVLAFSPDGKLLAVGNKDGLIRLWHAATGKEIGGAGGHQGLVRSLDFSPDGNLLASTSGHDGTLRLWGTAGGSQLRKLVLRGPERRGYEDSDLKRVRFSPDGKTLAVATSTGKVRVLDVATGEWRHELAHDGSYLSDVAWSPDGKYLASSGWHECAIRVWDAATGKLIHTIAPNGAQGRSDSEVHAVAFSPDSKLLATGSSYRNSSRDKPSATIHLWDTATGQEVRRFRPGEYPVIHLAFTGDGKSLVSSTSASNSSTVEVWTVATGKRTHELPAALDGGNNSWRGSAPIALTPDGKLLATSGTDHAVVLWELATGKEVRRLCGHKGPVTALAFTPDGQTLASGSQDTTVLLWKLSAPEKEKPGPAPDAKQLEQCWQSLTESDPEPAYLAMWLMARGRNTAVFFLKRHLQPAGDRDPARITQLVEKLGSDKDEERAAASMELRLFGAAAEPSLYAALRAKLALPTRIHAEKLLATIGEHPIAPEELQRLRGVQILEWVGTPEAVAFLEDLSGGHVTAPLTHDARVALRRLLARGQLTPVRLSESGQR